MSLTLSVLRRRLASRIGRENGNSVLNIKLDDIINDSIQEFLASASWFFMKVTDTISLVNATQSYVLTGLSAGTVDKILDNGVKLTTTQTPLLYLSERDLPQVVTSPLATGTPKYYGLRSSDAIQFYPIPTSAVVTAETSVTIEFLKEGLILAADGTASPLPTKWDSIMLYRAEEMAQDLVGNSEKSGRAGFRWERGLERAIQDNRFIVETSSRDIIPTSHENQNQSKGLDQRIDQRITR